MNQFLKKVSLVFFSLLLLQCTSNKEPQKTTLKKKTKTQSNNRAKFYSSCVDITTYDGKRKLETGYGFMISPTTLVCPYRMFARATKASIKPWGKNKTYSVDRYIAVDRVNDIIILKTDSITRTPFQLQMEKPKNSISTLIMKKKRGKLLIVSKGKFFSCDTVSGTPYYRVSNKIQKYMKGMPVLDPQNKVIGMGLQMIVDFEKTSYALPAYLIQKLLSQKSKSKSLSSLRETSNVEQKRNAGIKEVILSTTYGDIHIKLFNNMPQYRDNFVKLIKEGFYNQLLFHRVIESFVIQSGAADSREAVKGDLVGWKGPGYTLPAFINPKYFHQRGMVGSPRLPNDVNTDKRSDGGQFYIVQGRRYTNSGLDNIEKENHYKFTKKQREVYRTIGGAPTLDGEYTIFGRVIKGMDVVDKIAKEPVDEEWRPLKDIRLKHVAIKY
ncbi:peptidylprolyl isomerase [Halosquirtibacter laminarini]|uniref:Peptidylprolyl isomerase n=1 Tax=Halosquirtibacter laminarini TaxID=3374600 RepID=A0AC61NR09_9BACT|nr:peptidylprolyl isomerase [Prolixibacteraceae bacterium]